MKRSLPKLSRNKFFPTFSLFSRQGQFRDQSRELFFFPLFSGRRPETHFLPGRRVLKTKSISANWGPLNLWTLYTLSGADATTRIYT